MKSIEANKLIDKMQRDLQKNGLNIEVLIEDLRNLRFFAVNDKEPAMAKLIRLTVEHLEEFEAFNIPLPSDENLEDENLEVIEENNDDISDEDADDISDEDSDEDADENTEAVKISGPESLDYLLSLILENHNKFNKDELIEYRDLLLEYEED